ncbi:MAG: hypothetical protein IKF39_04200 [Oscillospiraceae bacterium]|nr:hypothetical protein [Oscillospiraceae bacterium]
MENKDIDARIQTLRKQIAAAEKEIEYLLKEKRTARRKALKDTLIDTFDFTEEQAERAIEKFCWKYLEKHCGAIMQKLTPEDIAELITAQAEAAPDWVMDMYDDTEDDTEEEIEIYDGDEDIEEDPPIMTADDISELI